MPPRLSSPLACALLVLAALVAHAQPAAAGAWPQAEDGGFITFPLTPYVASTRGYDRRGLATGNGTQRSLDFGPYWEHGLSPRWTFGMQPRLSAVWMDQNGSRQHNFGLAETGFFLRHALYVGERDVLSVQGGVSLPGLADRRNNPSLAETNSTYEARLLYGRGIPLGNGINMFIDLEVAYRYRAGPAADVLFLNNTIGIRPFDHWGFWVQSLTDLGLRNGRANGADYSAQRLGVHAAWDYSPSSSIVFSYLRDVATRHVASGQGGTIAYWYRY